MVLLGTNLFGGRSMFVVATSFIGRLLAMLVRMIVFVLGFVAFTLTSIIGVLSMLGVELPSVQEVFR